MLAVLLTLSALVAAWRVAGEGVAGHAVIRCTDKACFTLHENKTRFAEANKHCFQNGGYLLTMRDEEEVEDARALLTLAGEAGLFSGGDEKLWIGLKLSKGSCVLQEDPLRGFRWVSAPVDWSAHISWAKEPRSTCAEERCVTVRVGATGFLRMNWKDGSCRESGLFACRFNFRGMCEPLALAGPAEVSYNVPFLAKPLQQGDDVRKLPHGTFADVRCVITDEQLVVFCSEARTGALGFTWNQPGPFCESGGRTCTHLNGGCSHMCSEDTGDVRCSCRQGYYLDQDMFTCLKKDACQNAPCAHLCVALNDGFRCECRAGFRRNGTGCVDVDECEQSVCGQHTCLNKPGSYQCVCQTGYKKVTGNACEDIDECNHRACGKHAKCLNSQGSFSCYCSIGFRHSDMGKDCVDVDECLSRPCEDICTNTVGSYTCSCRSNYGLADNGISCIQVVEPSTHTSVSKEPLNEGLTESTTATTIIPLLKSNGEGAESQAKSWMLMWVLGSAIPLLLLVALIFLIAIMCWNRSRKDEKKKGPTADSYCWVSSGFQIQADPEKH